MGKTKKPTKLKLIEGNPGKRPLPKNEPKPKIKKSKAPKWLDETARAIWDEYEPKLRNLELLTEIDQEAFAAFCHCASMFRQYAERAARGEIIFKQGRKDGNFIQIPSAKTISIEYMNQLKSWCGRFGLTPSDRASLGIAEKDSSSEFEKLLD